MAKTDPYFSLTYEQKQAILNDTSKRMKEVIKSMEKDIATINYPEMKRKYEGKFFRTRNTYGGDSKGWWLYTNITLIKEEDVYDTGGQGITTRYSGWSFEKTEHGDIEICTKKTGYAHSCGEEITEDVFISAWNTLADSLNSTTGF